MPNLLKARGLITYRNEINVADGAMDVADNIVIDEDDVVELRRGQGDFGDSLPLEAERVKQVAEYKDLLLRHYNSTLQFEDGSGTFSDFSGSYQELEDGLRIKYLEANGNFYFTDIAGIKKISARNSSQITTNSVEEAGIPRAVSLEALVKYELGGFLPPQSKVAYRVLWGKKDNNSNLLLGYPSERFVLTNTSDTVNINESFQIQIKNSTINNDDIITFGVGDAQFFIWFEVDGAGDAPEIAATLGRVPVKVSLITGNTVEAIASKIATALANVGLYNVTLPNATTVQATAVDPGNIEDPVAYLNGAASDTNLAVTMLQQGSITNGDSANATVSFTVPAGIDNTYFYQIYRTSSVTVPTGFSLDDIDPGDEMNLVYEGNPLDASGNLLTEVTVEDITPEDFRAASDFLYTNPISGEGILQANARPPVAKDITLFNGSNFFANTKTTHKSTVNLVSVASSRWASGVSDFIVGNEDVTRKYTAIGETRVETLEVTTSALNERAFLVDSARDERSYYVWYDEDGTAVRPATYFYDLNTFTATDEVLNTVIIASHGLVVDQEVQFISETGDLPTNIEEGVTYKVLEVVDASTFKITLDGITEVDLINPVGASRFTLKAFVLDEDLQNKIAVRVVYNTTLLEGIDATTDVNAGNEEITIPDHGLVQGQEVQVVEETGKPGGTSTFVIYKVLVVNTNTIQLSENGITPKNISTAAGTFALKAYPVTEELALKTAEALASTFDFVIDTVEGSSTITVNWAKNGNVTEGLRSTYADPEFNYTVVTVGDGENAAAQEFLLSNQISVAAAIDETARSLVKVINADPLSPVNAYYTSGASDVPGAFLLEARNLEDKAFYIGTSDPNIVDDFSPSLNKEIAILSTTPNGTSTDVELANTDNVFQSQEMFFYDTDGNLPFANGKYTVDSIAGNVITINADSGLISSGPNTGATIVAGNESDNEESLNRLYFSKAFQPEAVPLTNFIDIGPRDKAISRILPLRDNLFALKEDGVYIISGSSAPNFTVRLLDSSVSIVAPDSAVVLNNAIYALSDDGVVRISDTGVEVISRNIEDLIKSVVNSRFNFEKTAFGISYSSDRSYLLWLPTLVSDTVATQCYRYNTFTRTWTRFTIPATCGLVASRDDKMYLGSGDRNVMTQERKNGDRTDFADRDFDIQIQPDGVVGTEVKVSSAVEVEEGDVIYQEQYVTLAVLRGLLRKLDIDAKVPSNDYFASFTVEAGAKISTIIDGIVDKLLLDGITVTDIVTSDDIVEQRNQYNNLIDELIDSPDVSFKNYRKADVLVSYEMVIQSVRTINNSITLYYEAPFAEGTVTIFKGIDAKWQYAPQHFGDPSSLKQIRQGTIIFDQNNFYGGVIAYASDQSADFIDVPFTGYGVGYWGSEDWGNGTWGGSGNDIPHRTLVPLEKQRCRYLTVQIRHGIAREILRVNGISLMVRMMSNRAYR